MTDEQIIEIANRWAKEPGFREFEHNDFIGCVREILAVFHANGRQLNREAA